MPLSFPIASSAHAALNAQAAARTLVEARELAGAAVTLVSEWLRPTPAEREDVQGKADIGVARGFVQLYEDARGQPVIAVTFWKPQTASAKAAVKGRKGKTADEAPAVAPSEDHTDDLYFAKASSRTKKRKRSVDPNQLDLFTGPSQQGHEHRDPLNPSVVIVEEEGDGEASGLAQEARDAPGDDPSGKGSP